ncbi:hypothetical protein [Mesorhizobium sp. WSM3868]|uniref:hypothetical protein n=1 Tax=Mesorhizobium sp. WSM3868 TaxID=2029405 RepID=UPI0032B00897
MKFTLRALLPLTLIAGCSSSVASINPAKYDGMSCAELNSALGDTATDISRTAISRGKVANTSADLAARRRAREDGRGQSRYRQDRAAAATAAGDHRGQEEPLPVLAVTRASPSSGSLKR